MFECKKGSIGREETTEKRNDLGKQQRGNEAPTSHMSSSDFNISTPTTSGFEEDLTNTKIKENVKSRVSIR